MRLAAYLGNRRGRRACAVVAQIGHCNARALPGQGQRSGLSDTATGTGDDGDAARNLLHSCLAEVNWVEPNSMP